MDPAEIGEVNPWGGAVSWMRFRQDDLDNALDAIAERRSEERVAG
jgi:hypothetical protein